MYAREKREEKNPTEAGHMHVFKGASVCLTPRHPCNEGWVLCFSLMMASFPNCLPALF